MTPVTAHSGAPHHVCLSSAKLSLTPGQATARPHLGSKTKVKMVMLCWQRLEQNSPFTQSNLFFGTWSSPTMATQSTELFTLPHAPESTNHIIYEPAGSYIRELANIQRASQHFQGSNFPSALLWPSTQHLWMGHGWLPVSDSTQTSAPSSLAH